MKSIFWAFPYPVITKSIVVLKGFLFKIFPKLEFTLKHERLNQFYLRIKCVC